MNTHNERYKARCIESNKCKRCPQQNDNPTSFICKACTAQHKLTQRARAQTRTEEQRVHQRKVWKRNTQRYRYGGFGTAA